MTGRPAGEGRGMAERSEGRKEALTKLIGYRFRDPALLERALTHSSFAHEGLQASHAENGGSRAASQAENGGSRAAPQATHYESLEFLGDAVLGFLVAERIHRLHPARSEGEMSRLRASLVSARSLADRAKTLGLGEHVYLGRGERLTGGEVKRSILADVFEAVLGAIYLDGGIRAARSFVTREFGADIRSAPPSSPQLGDYKTRLQEIVQSNGGPPPKYVLVSEQGPPHQRRFEVEVVLPGGELFRATGSSKKGAEQAAAERALRSIGDGPDGAAGPHGDER